jgi:hypothetical protein
MGIWSEGEISTLLFSIDEINNDVKLQIDFKPYITKKNNNFEFDIYVNNFLNRKIMLNNDREQMLEIPISKNFFTENEIKIDFKFKNLVSPYEALQNPDSRKLGVLLKSIKVSTI